MRDRSIRKAFWDSFYRLAASGLLPRRWFAGELPPRDRDPAVADPPRPLRLEIVSHCWRYTATLAYQLGSLVLHPPRRTDVRMTVFYSPDDTPTDRLLRAISDRPAPERVAWNWQPLAREQLFRRCIGRNRAARRTEADWIWFTDCDVLFHEGALDAAAAVLRGRNDYLVFPRFHGVSPLLEPDHPMLQLPPWTGSNDLRLPDIRPGDFTPEERFKAAGAFQITRGDVARSAGYCGSIRFYQDPVLRWQKCYDDRTFRWLLGTQGIPVEIPGIYRIRHVHKGRKADPGQEHPS